MKIALLCSGLGNVYRGHETFARGLFDLMRDSVDIALFKGGGVSGNGEMVIDHVPRNSPDLEHVHVVASARWAEAARESERVRIEGETFGYAALRPLLAGGYDIIHCLEREVCEVIYTNRNLFTRIPRVVFSNGGAIPARKLPRCDFVQEHSPYNLAHSAREKAFMIPHGVDTTRFRPGLASDFRERHAIPRDAFLVISVGTIGYWHKRMDYVIREVAAIDDAYLLIVGQPCQDTPAIRELGERSMGSRIVFSTLTHDELPQAYAAADVFALGSLSETFGIVYVEALAMGLPVFCTNHPNQREIVKEGVFVDMTRRGALTDAIRSTDKKRLSELASRGREIAVRDYDLRALKARYIEHYQRITSSVVSLPEFTLQRKIAANIRNVLRRG